MVARLGPDFFRARPLTPRPTPVVRPRASAGLGGDMAAPPRKGPRVRGICPAGHVVETDAPQGRITWRGPCPGPTGGPPCALPVIARRIAGEGDVAPSSPLQPRPAGAPGRTVRKAASYRDDDPARPSEPGFHVGPGDQPVAPPDPPNAADPGDPGVDPAPGAPGSGPARSDVDDDLEPGGAGARPGLIERVWRLGSGARTEEFDDPRTWTAPGVYR